MYINTYRPTIFLFRERYKAGSYMHVHTHYIYIYIYIYIHTLTESQIYKYLFNC